MSLTDSDLVIVVVTCPEIGNYWLTILYPGGTNYQDKNKEDIKPQNKHYSLWFNVAFICLFSSTSITFLMKKNRGVALVVISLTFLSETNKCNMAPLPVAFLLVFAAPHWLILVEHVIIAVALVFYLSIVIMVLSFFYFYIIIPHNDHCYINKMSGCHS